jgi:RNA polymerase sigma-70 factor, ECF subfamily
MDDFQAYRPLLFSIAYRMTGSASQAEDIVQDAYLHYRQADTQAICSLKSFLTTIVTNLCLNYLKSARVKREEYVGIWLPEPVLTADAGEESLAKLEQQESVSLAFLVLLEALTPPERAIFLLHEVFDYSFAEIAEMVDKTPENCRQLFHRAKDHLVQRRQRVAVSPETHRQLMESFVAACQSGNLASLTALLARDATAWADGGGKVRAALQPVTGRETIAQLFLELMRRMPANHRLFIEEINGAPALLSWSDSQLNWVLALDIYDNAIVGLRSILNPEKLAFLQRQLERRS